MKAIKQTYVIFLYPECLYIESSIIRKIATRDVSILKVPKNTFSFIFFDVVYATASINGKKVRLKSKQINISSLHFYGGKVYTIAELKCKFPEGKEELFHEIEKDQCEKVIVCRDDVWRRFEDTDVLIEIT